MLPHNSNSLILIHQSPEHIRRSNIPPQPRIHISLTIRLANVVQEHWGAGLICIGADPEAVVKGAVRRALLAEVVERQLDVLGDNVLGLGGCGRGREEGCHYFFGVHWRAIWVQTRFGLGEMGLVAFVGVR